MRKHLSVLLVIMTVALLVGAGTVETSIPTPRDGLIYASTKGTIEAVETKAPIEIFNSNSLIVYQDDGYIQIKSEAVGTNYLIQIKSSDGLIQYSYVPYSTNVQTVPLPDTDKVKLTLFEKADGDLYKSLSSIEFRVNIKDGLRGI